MQQPADTRTPVHVLTGFLGSGKTTVLRHMLRDPAFADTAVLINEVGEIGLDHLLVGQLHDRPVLLPGGCICCMIRGDLSRAIGDLYARCQRGDLPPFRRLVIETSGLADPVPILATISSDLSIRRHFRTGNVIATMDPIHAEKSLARAEAQRQAAVADRLILTKVDIAAPDRVAWLREHLQRLNPSALLVATAGGAIDPITMFEEEFGRHETRLAEVQHWLAGDGDMHTGAPGGVQSVCLTLDEPVGWSAFGLWLSALVHCHGEKLLRVKAVLQVEGSATPVALHAVQHLIYPPEHLPAWPETDHRSRLVFITTGFTPAQLGRLERSLRAFARQGLRKSAAPAANRYSRQ
jgi:G3E family GTPase